MKHKSSKPNLTLEAIESSIRTSYPDFQLFYRKNLSGRHLIIQKTNSSGLGVWINNETIKVQEIIPNTKMAMLLGSTGLLGMWIIKTTNKQTWNQFNNTIKTHITNTF